MHPRALFFRPRVFAAILLVSLVPAWAGSARAEEFSQQAERALRQHEGKRVGKIEVAGLKRIERDAVIGKLNSRVGDPLKQSQVRLDLQALVKMGFFEAVDIKALSSDDGVELRIEVRERPVISKLEFDGNEKVSTEDLQEVVKVKEWSILDVNSVREDVGLIQKHYEDKGFYLAKVSYDLTPVKGKKDEIHLTYRVNDYDKVEIKKITFLNNKKFSDEALKGVFAETREGSFFSFMNDSGNFKESAFKTDLQRLTYWYLDNGYIKFRYENPVVTVSDDKRWLYITVYVEEGQQYEMGDTSYSGDLLFTTDQLSEGLTLLKGEMFGISKRNADIQKLSEMYQDLGYAFVNVVPKMQVRDESLTVDVEYVFEKGNLVYFGEINMVGNAKTYDKVIRRELKIHEGELYNGTNLRVSRERVERLGYFAPGEVVFNTITRKDRDDVVDIEISIKERSTGTITLGAGYGSVQKFFLTTQISEINLFGKGQTLSLQAQYAASNSSRSFNLGFTDPYAFDSKWSMGFDIFSIHLPIPNRYLTRKLGFDVRLGYPILEDLYAFITYKNEGLQISEKEDPSEDTSLEEGVLSSIVWSAVRDKRNNRFEPTKGTYFSASLETAGLGGDKKFLKWIVNHRYYTRVIGDLVFRNAVEYGQVAQTTDRGIPSTEKFFLGGPNNLKGYEIFTVGPGVLEGEDYRPSGGSVELYALFELEYPLIREAGLKWVLFYDAGNAFSRFPGTGGEKFLLRTDAGFGFRWFSPIGPLRFEWGFPFDKRGFDDTSVFQFFIGPPF
ncbi:MAG: outer membrane protein assembly factor BamA [Bdellovibrionales bacterium]|nr:outer membrane protein assembly factor BamA [Bdellovibrionales bacterium]